MNPEPTRKEHGRDSAPTPTPKTFIVSEWDITAHDVPAGRYISADDFKRELAQREQRIDELEMALGEIRARLPAKEYVQDGLTARELKHIIAFVDQALATPSPATN